MYLYNQAVASMVYLNRPHECPDRDLAMFMEQRIISIIVLIMFRFPSLLLISLFQECYKSSKGTIAFLLIGTPVERAMAMMINLCVLCLTAAYKPV